ncbi:MAG TPA: lysophospholipid acyltransferase family protein [Nocardioides sp.]|nr:lysophospholipid acyltransferase family protein [Nocardioides sp.]
MADAEIIPIGSGGRPGRGTGDARPSRASRTLAGGSARPQPRRRTPRPAAVEPEPEATDATDVTGPTAPEVEPVADEIPVRETRRPTRTADREPLAGLSPADWLAALRAGAVQVFGDDWEPQLAQFLAFLRRRLSGEYDVDQYGFDPEVAERLLLASLRPLAEKWFRIEVRGAENLPDDGGALVGSNHSGTVPVDALMTMFTVHEETGRFLRPLGADLVFRLPFVSTLARRGGATLACNEDAERMLAGGELVGVWPEGFKGIGKPFNERYKLQRFGRGGFVAAALRTRVPIVPLSVVGAEEIYPLVGNIPPLARLLGLPYVPVTPLFPWLGPLGMVPLPSKWLMEFGEPIRTDEYDDGAADDPMLVFNVTDQVRETIQQSLYALLVQRSSVWH